MVNYIDCRSPLSMGLGSTRSYSEDVTHEPVITDPELQRAFKDLLADSWNELPDSLIYDVKAALAKNTDDKAGKEAVTNVFRAAEAVEEFGGIIMNFKMELDDTIGMSGEVLFAVGLDFNFLFLFSLFLGPCTHKYGVLNLFVECKTLDRRVCKCTSYNFQSLHCLFGCIWA